MSATETAPAHANPKIPFTRLVSVETRKMLDTRGGRWLLIITALLLLVALGLTLLVLALNDDVGITASGFAEIMVIPLSILLPVFAILTVTSEWSQRTNLVTFSLEPHRGKVFAAKYLAVVILALGAIVVAIVAGAIGNVIYGMMDGAETTWNLDGSVLAWNIALQLIFFSIAFAFGLVFLNTPAAVALFYVIIVFVPFMVYSTLMALFEWARNLIPWIDVNIAAAPFISEYDWVGNPVELTGENYAQLAVSITIWLVIPLIVGTLRVLKIESK